MDAGLTPVEATAKAMSVQFEEVQSRIGRSLSRIGDDVRAMAGTVSQEAQRAAESQVAVTQALQERSAALSLTRNKNFDAAESAKLLAAAESKVRAAQLESAESARARRGRRLRRLKRPSFRRISGFAAFSASRARLRSGWAKYRKRLSRR
jgi:hypothetical protein